MNVPGEEKEGSPGSSVFIPLLRVSLVRARGLVDPELVAKAQTDLCVGVRKLLACSRSRPLTDISQSHGRPSKDVVQHEQCADFHRFQGVEFQKKVVVMPGNGVERLLEREIHTVR